MCSMKPLKHKGHFPSKQIRPPKSTGCVNKPKVMNYTNKNLVNLLLESFKYQFWCIQTKMVRLHCIWLAWLAFLKLSNYFFYYQTYIVEKLEKLSIWKDFQRMWIYCYCLKALFASKSAVENVAHGIELHWLTESLGLGLVIMRPEFQWLLDTLFQDKMHCPFTRTSIYLLLKVKLFYNQQPKNRF